MVSGAAALTHAVVAVALVAAYAVVTALGHDGDALLGVLAGYLGGATATTAADNARGRP